MSYAYYIKKTNLVNDPKLLSLLESLEKNFTIYQIKTAEEIRPGTKALLSFGGDGTFLSASAIAIQANIPILGVNFGRLGFLTGSDMDSLANLLISNDLQLEHRELLQLSCSSSVFQEEYPFALNEISVARLSASMLGVDVEIDGVTLPTYWADGLLIATSSGSTAYSLSVGGPICIPESNVFILSPISPHNLNIRPLIIPQNSVIRLGLHSRDGKARLSLDNRNYVIEKESVLEVSLAPVTLQRLSSGSESFINALRSRLHWGEDLRNK